ncbi:hypothetical protein [Labedella endophytica]|uniref:Uncharacterized protein n=1 Tax=Labedella endophytica TaxID=1523160 RepID=A0A433JSX5_9MICO|nr:hypothetical protein [Labedella endophytica]RUR01423.1 hypothetical protein ELQ94_07960 [Labedella endophytica]
MSKWTVVYGTMPLAMTDEDAARLYDLYASGQATAPTVFDYRMDVRGFEPTEDSIVIGPGIPIHFTRKVG